MCTMSRQCPSMSGHTRNDQYFCTSIIGGAQTTTQNYNGCLCLPLLQYYTELKNVQCTLVSMVESPQNVSKTTKLDYNGCLCLPLLHLTRNTHTSIKVKGRELPPVLSQGREREREGEFYYLIYINIFKLSCIRILHSLSLAHRDGTGYTAHRVNCKERQKNRVEEIRREKKRQIHMDSLVNKSPLSTTHNTDQKMNPRWLNVYLSKS